MTKNANGGKKAKSFARKHATTTSAATLFSTCELERYAIVTKLLGNGMFYATTDHDQELIGHIRNKFKGRYKHSNLVVAGSFILLGLRSWENPPKHADLIHIYEADEIHTVHSQHNIQNLLHLTTNLSGYHSSSQSAIKTDDIFFTTHDDTALEEDIAHTSSDNKKEATNTIMVNSDVIDIDDI
jgi:translation initiation factor IF-1